jgi:Phage integrase, N-terminal SAM-like domain
VLETVQNSRIDLATEGLIPYFKTLIEQCGTNKNTVIDFILSLKDKDNLRPNSLKGYISCITRLSGFHKHKPFKNMKAEDVQEFLIHLKKSESEDPMHKWIGMYNLYVVLVKRFF